MSIEPHEAEMEAAFDKLSEELYEQHKEMAVEEFINERFVSHYKKQSMVMRPAVEAIQEGKKLLSNNHYSAALVFYVSAIEILLKATLLRPVLMGMVHNDAIAELFVNLTLGQSGFKRYTKLLSGLYRSLLNLEIDEIRRESSNTGLLAECSKMQEIRNGIVHKGETCSKEEAEISRLVATATFEQIVKPVLNKIGLNVVKNGEIVGR